MNTLNRYLLLGAALGTAFPAFTFAQQSANGRDSAHAVFVMTNSAQENEVIAYERTPFGTLHDPHAYRTDGRGSGGKVDPLASQGSLTLSKDRSWL